MPDTRTIQVAFSGGELSPRMFGRADDRRYASGLKRARNWITDPRGPATVRPGTRYVATTLNATDPSRLIPFRFSVDQALVLEFGTHVDGGYIRLYGDGGTYNWATPRNVGEQDGGNVTVATPGILAFDAPHGFSTNDAVRLTSTGTDLPGGLGRAFTYYVIVLDRYRIQLELTIGGGALAITATNTGYMRVFLASEFPQDFQAELVINETSWNPATDTVTSVAHGYANGTPVRLTTSGTLPAGLTDTYTYYIVGAAADTFQLALYVGGPAVNFTDDGTGDHTVHRYYLQGELVSWIGGTLDPGIWYAVREHAAGAEPLNTPTTNWRRQPNDDGALTIPSPYAQNQLFDLNYDQSNDIMTFAHRSHPLYELRRYSALRWVMQAVTYQTTLPAPFFNSITVNRGRRLSIQQVNRGVAAPGGNYYTEVQFYSSHGLIAGDTVYFESSIAGYGITAGNFYVVEFVRVVSSEPVTRVAAFSTLDGNPVTTSLSGGAAIGNVYPTSLSSDLEQVYVATVVDTAGNESTASDEATAENILATPGSSNTISLGSTAWISGNHVARYRVYKKLSGIFGWIGETTDGTFVDDFIGPDTGFTIPLQDEDLIATEYPRAVSYFEQRKVIAGLTSYPQGLWMTRTGTEHDFTYHLPVLPDDRIRAQIASRDSQTILHIVPIGQLLLLTESAIWRVASIDNGPLTPESIGLRPDVQIGSSTVRPVVTDSTVLFVAATNSHVHVLTYDRDRFGYLPRDISQRAEHLFASGTLVDSARMRSPWPIIWWTTSEGHLLGNTFVPEEEVEGWHRHETDGSFRSIAVIPEDRIDRAYVCVERTIGGTTRHYIERFDPIGDDADVFTDSALAYDGTNASGITMTATGGTLWRAGESVTITASALWFRREDVGNLLELRDGQGVPHRIEITARTSASVVIGRLLSDLPSDLRGAATATWALAVDRIAGLDHLEGKSVRPIVDGIVYDPVVVTNGSIALEAFGTQVSAGTAYEPELVTLPLVVPIDGIGRGREKVISKVWLQVFEAAGLSVGPEDGATRILLANDANTTGEIPLVLDGAWDQDGALLIRQHVPRGATLTAMTLGVTFGGG